MAGEWKTSWGEREQAAVDGAASVCGVGRVDGRSVESLKTDQALRGGGKDVEVIGWECYCWRVVRLTGFFDVSGG